MPKFRKKPIVIEAVQYDGKNNLEIYEWAGRNKSFYNPTLLLLSTREGPVSVMPGDWVIRDSKGNFSMCTPGIFEREYETASNQDAGRFVSDPPTVPGDYLCRYRFSTDGEWTEVRMPVTLKTPILPDASETRWFGPIPGFDEMDS